MRKSIFLGAAAIALVMSSSALAGQPNKGNNGNGNGPTTTTYDQRDYSVDNRDYSSSVDLSHTSYDQRQYNNLDLSTTNYDLSKTFKSYDQRDQSINNRAEGGDGGTGLGLGLGVAGAYSGPSTSGSSIGDTLSTSLSEGGAAEAKATNEGNKVQGGNTVVDASTRFERNPVNSAIALGASGGGGACPRFGPALAANGITFSAGVALPVFKDQDCVNLAYAEAIAEFAGKEAAVQFLSKRIKDINFAVTKARTK